MTTFIFLTSLAAVIASICQLWREATHKVRFHGQPSLEQSDEWFEDTGDGSPVTYHTPAKCSSCGLSIELVSTDYALIEHCRRGLVRRCPMCSNYTLRNRTAEKKNLGHRKSGIRCVSC